jgi:hypothetical protein
VCAVERLDHRHADERRVGEPGGKDKRCPRGSGELKMPAEQPDGCGDAHKHQPRHQDGDEKFAVELDAVDLQQRERRQRNVYDETIDREMGIVRDTARGAQCNAGREAEKQQYDIAHHGSPQAEAFLIDRFSIMFMRGEV